MNKKPNILLVIIDCLRSDRSVGINASAKTPNMRRLIDQGTLFPNLITVNSMTTPCMTSVFSGLYPHTHGVRALSYARVSENVPLMAEILRDNGYHTVGAATGPVGPYTHLDRGFNDYEHREGVGKSLLNEWGDAFIDRFRDKALPEPWFVYLHLWEVHMPRHVLPEYDSPEYGRTKYDRAVTSVDARLGELFAALDDNTLVFLSGDHGEKTADSGLESSIERLKSPVTHFLRRRLGGRTREIYRNMVGAIRSTWFSVARSMYRGGLIENPLSSITGHGFHVYDSLVRVPLIVSGHKPTKVGTVVDEQIRQIDILPTMLDLAGLQDAIPEKIDGRSVAPLVEGEPLASLPAIIESCQNPSEPSDLYGVRTEDWKYAVHISDNAVPEELYYLPDDPAETNNLVLKHPDVAKAMRAILAAHLQSDQVGGVSLADELSTDEMSELTKHLQKLGYIE